MMRKLITVLSVGMIILSSLAGFSSASAVKGVILVSNNPADLAMARLTANLTGFQVLVSPWGIYDPRISARIYTLSPKEVVVIGGSMAVPFSYTDDFMAANITVKRWWGKDRYETNMAVLTGLREMGIRLNGSAVGAPGSDPLSIGNALLLAVNKGAPLVFLSKGNGVNASTVFCPKGYGDNIKAGKVVYVGVTRESAEAMIDTASGEIKAVELLAERANASLDSILNAKELLNKALGAMSSGRYEDAYKFAERASNAAMEAAVELDRKLGLQLDVLSIEMSLHGIKPLAPDQYSELQSLLKEYRTALQEGNQEKAGRILTIIRIKFMRVYSTHRLGPAPRPGEPLEP